MCGLLVLILLWDLLNAGCLVCYRTIHIDFPFLVALLMQEWGSKPSVVVLFGVICFTERGIAVFLSIQYIVCVF